MSGTKWARFYFSDWVSDQGVRACSLGARGLWMDLLCIAGTNQGEDHGYVRIAGKAPTVQQIARLLGSTVEEVETLLRELEDNGVFSRTHTGVIYCRRMVRAEKSRRNGELGGNPNLLKTKENKNPVQPTPNPLIPRLQESKNPESKKESFSEWDFLSDDGQVFISKREFEELERDFPDLKNIRGIVRNSARTWASAEQYPNPRTRKQRILAALNETALKSSERVESHKRREAIVAASMEKKSEKTERNWQKGAIP